MVVLFPSLLLLSLPSLLPFSLPPGLLTSVCPSSSLPLPHSLSFPISLFFFPPPSSLSLSLSPPLLPLSPPLILSHQPIDHKNIRRRVYDALNVLMAMNIISKEKKDIKWIGLPTNSVQECQHIEV